MCSEALRSSMKLGFFYRRFFSPLLDLLQQGVTPEKLALSVALGAALGVFPVLGTTTALCALTAFVLRLNLPAIQIVNYCVYPLQIALLFPLFRAGEALFRSAHRSLSLLQISAMMRANPWASIAALWITTWHAIVVWCLLSTVLAAILYV